MKFTSFKCKNSFIINLIISMPTGSRFTRHLLYIPVFLKCC
uniref:Uncharacterized protein n=1 Tax=Klebsiella pneumoniae TaxID=573 RepID=A0A8B0SUV2_KLEPN|nr:hypothetical protein [Klebsiella pneumoniae]